MNKITHSPGVSVTINGKLYCYDSEADCYYRYRESTTWDTLGWLAVIFTLAAIAIYFEFYPLR